MRASELSVITKTYDYGLWLLRRLAGFSRDYRFELGRRLQDSALEVLSLLVECSYQREKAELLSRANLELEKHRYLIRLAKDLRQISIKQYEFAATALDGIGREVGGWARSRKPLESHVEKA